MPTSVEPLSLWRHPVSFILPWPTLAAAYEQDSAIVNHENITAKKPEVS
jgi:hypothetical protein